jgi:hypothetical protein
MKEKNQEKLLTIIKDIRDQIKFKTQDKIYYITTNRIGLSYITKYKLTLEQQFNIKIYIKQPKIFKAPAIKTTYFIEFDNIKY